MSHATVQLAEIVELLGRLWLYEVTADTLAAMQTEPFRGPYQELGGVLPRGLNESVIEELAVEYCELLIGPKNHISPVQSVWAENQFQSKTAASMSRFFDLIPGYQPESNLTDHIGVQLDFMSTILRQPDEVTASEITGLFAREHLLWIMMFVDRVEAQSDSEFYRGLAKVTRNLVQTITASIIPKD